MRKKFAQGLPAIALALGLAIAVTGCDNGAGAGAGATMNPALIGVWVQSSYDHVYGWFFQRWTISDGHIVAEFREGTGPWQDMQRVTFTTANGMMIARLTHFHRNMLGLATGPEWLDLNAALPHLLEDFRNRYNSQNGQYPSQQAIDAEIADIHAWWNETIIWSYTVAGNYLILTEHGFPPMHLTRQ